MKFQKSCCFRHCRRIAESTPCAGPVQGVVAIAEDLPQFRVPWMLSSVRNSSDAMGAWKLIKLDLVMNVIARNGQASHQAAAAEGIRFFTVQGSRSKNQERNLCRERNECGEVESNQRKNKKQIFVAGEKILEFLWILWVVPLVFLSQSLIICFMTHRKSKS